MKTRKLRLGNRNIVVARATEERLKKSLKQNEFLAKLQAAGMDMSTPVASLLEE